MHLLLLCTLLCAPGAAHAANLVENGGFEEGVATEGVAAGWADNSSWADLDARYAHEAAGAHSGRACQRVTCTRLTEGAVQVIPAKGIPLRKGATYFVSAWLRGTVGQVALQLRQAPAPYRVYVETALSVGREWRELRYLWTCTEDDPGARLMLRFTQKGDLWVDDVSVAEVTRDEAARLAPPPRAGNLLHNGRFDLGLANWLVSHNCDAWREATLTVERADGNPCLKMSVPEGVSVTLSSDVVPGAAGHPLALSLRARASRPVPLSVASGFSGTRAEVGTAWQTIRAAGTAGFRPSLVNFARVSVTGPVTLWLDDVQLRQDGRSDGEGQRAAILTGRHPMALYHDGEEPALRLASAAPAGATPSELAWRVEDFWGKTRLSGRWQPGPGTQEKPILCGALPRGWYRASVTWREGTETLRNESTFCRLPPTARSGDAATSPFGAHFSVDATGLRLAKAVGIRWLRLHPPNHTKWRVVEPKPGEWNWRDDPIRIARQAGLVLCGSLDRLPNWASSAPAGTPDGGFYTGLGAWLPRDWTEWENYVAETIRRHRSDIHVWEIWNEPNLTSWLIPREGQTRAQAYVEMLRHTTPIVRREDPGATIIGGCVAGALHPTSEAWRFTEEIIDSGALELMDIFSFHEYIARSVDEGDDPLEQWIARLRAKMRAAGREIPILNSEGGFANPGTSLTYRPVESSTVPADRMARWLVRQYVAQLAVGVDRFFFYNFFVDGSPITRMWEGFVEGDGQPRPNVAAYATMSWLLDGAAFERTERLGDEGWLHHFRTSRGRITVAWAKTGATVQHAFAGAARAYDLMGAAAPLLADKVLVVTDAPAYVLSER